MGVVDRREILEDAGAAGRGHVLGGQDVLDGDGDTPQGPGRVGPLGVHGAGLFQGGLAGHMQQGLDVRLGGGDALQAGGSGGLGRYIAGAQEVADLAQGKIVEL
jgi:hypothetical protein